MLDKIKKIQGINHNEFDDMITTWISAGKQDLINIGILESLVNEENPYTELNPLIETAIIQFVLSQLDVVNAEMYSNSYALLKDTLRHVSSYYEVSNAI